MGNGVRHTEKINSYTKDLTKKKIWFVYFSNLIGSTIYFISKIIV